MKPNNKGTIIRLIDIVMILLLGFMLSSTVIHRNELQLPSKSGRKSPKQNQKDQIVPLEIMVLAGDTTMLDINPKTETSRMVLGQLYCYYQVIEQNRRYKIRMLDKLEEYLLRTRASYDSVIVIIKPDSQSIIQGTINLIDICRRNGFTRKFQYTED